MEAAGQTRSNRWERDSSGSDVDPEDLLSEEQRGYNTTHNVVCFIECISCVV